MLSSLSNAHFPPIASHLILGVRTLFAGEFASLNDINAFQSPLVISLDIYREDPEVTDLLIRDVPDEVIAAIDAAAKQLGLSRAEYLRRLLARDCRSGKTVTVSDLEHLCHTFSGLGDPELMDQAWK